MSLPRDDHGPVPPGLDRTPPQNIELEMSVLGAVMLEPKEAMPLLINLGLSRESFYLEGHSLIWEIMCELHRQGIPPDSVAVLDALRREVREDDRGQTFWPLLNRVGGSGVVLGMLNSVPTAANIEYHARRVIEKAYLRQLIRASTRVIEDCYRQELPISDVLDRAESSILAINAHVSMTMDAGIPTVAGEIAGGIIEQIVARAERIEDLTHNLQDGKQLSEDEIRRRVVPGIKTNFFALDRAIGGMRPGEVLTIGAVTSGGKSALAATLAHHVAVQQKKSVVYITLEMPREQVVKRMLTIGSKHFDQHSGKTTCVTSEMIDFPRLTETQWQALQHSNRNLSSSPFAIFDGGHTVQAIKSKLSRHWSTHGPVSLLIVDYLQLIKRGPEQERMPDTPFYAWVANELHELAIQFRIPIIMLTQFNRNIYNLEGRAGKKGQDAPRKEPGLEDAFGSSGIVMASDICLWVHYEDGNWPDQKGFAENDFVPSLILVKKNRDRALARVNVLYMKAATRFLNAGSG